jgi:hypothetical protein
VCINIPYPPCSALHAGIPLPVRNTVWMPLKNTGLFAEDI